MSIGCHSSSFRGSILEVLELCKEYGTSTVQFFLGSPKSFTRSKICDSDIAQSIEFLKTYPIHVFTHFPYVANLAGSKDRLAWKDDEEQNRKTEFILQGLEYELNVMAKLVSETCKTGVVIHPGNHIHTKNGLKAIAKSISKIRFDKHAKLLLENSAGGGTSLATTFKQIAYIIARLDEETRKHVGVCIDTAHIFGYGKYNISNVENAEKLFQQFDEIIGAEYFSLLHLNDSEVECGTKKDRHACIGTGFIWKDGFDSLRYILGECKRRNVPVVLETTGRDVAVLRALELN